MEMRTIGTTGIEVASIALGCWPMGGDYWGGTDDDESLRTIHKAEELGVNFLDTAPAYGRGHSEEVVGKGLVGRRDKWIVSTKASGNGNSDIKVLRQKLATSLERLQMNYVDIYFIHWPSREEPMAQIIENMEALRAEGMIRAVGVSNFDANMLEMAGRYGTIDILQPPYNFIWRFIEEDVMPYCIEHSIGTSTYSSLAQGLLTGTIRLDTRYAGTDQRTRSVLWKSENLGKCLYTVERLRACAKDLGVTLAQLSLAWLVAQEGVTTSLVGARTVDEITDNAGAMDLTLSPEILAKLQDISNELYRSFPFYYDMWGNWMTWQKRGAQREK